MSAAITTTLNDCTAYRETIAAQPPRIAHLGVILCVTTLAAGLMWAALTPVDPLAIAYLKRLSDALFVWSRWASLLAGAEEWLWDPNRAASARDVQ